MANYIITFLGNICELLIVMFFFKGNHKLRFNKKITILLSCLLVLFQFTSNVLFLWQSTLVIIGAILFTLGIVLLFKVKPVNTLLYTVVLYLFLATAEMIIGMGMALIFDIDIAFTHDNPLVYAICSLASKFTSYVLVLFTKAKRFNFNSENIRQAIFGLFMLPISSVLTMFLFLRCCYQIEDTSFRIFTIIASIVMCVANISTFRILDKQNELLDTKEKLFFAQTHINNQAMHYEELYKHQTELKTFRHDIKNRLLALMGLLKEGNTDKVMRIMQRNLDFIDEMNRKVINTGNPVIDAILQSKLRDANSNGIKIHISIKLTDKIDIDELELGIVLGNALDNAIEASSKLKNVPDKEIFFTLITTAGRISVSIENPVADDVDINTLTTSKQDKNLHGFGINSIRTIVNKYDGVTDFVCKDGKFVTNINLANIKAE